LLVHFILSVFLLGLKLIFIDETSGLILYTVPFFTVLVFCCQFLSELVLFIRGLKIVSQLNPLGKVIKLH